MNTVVVVVQVLFSLVLAAVLAVIVLRLHGLQGLFDGRAVVNPETFDVGNVLGGASVLATSFLGFDLVGLVFDQRRSVAIAIPRAAAGGEGLSSGFSG